MPLSHAEKARQAQEAYEREGSHKAAAKSLGIAKSTLQEWLQLDPRVRVVEDIPDTHILSNIWTRMDANGEIIRQTRHDTPDKHRQALALREAVEAAKESIPRAKPEKPPQRTESDLCACYVLSDAHIGGLVWGEETRDRDWDSDIAEATILRWLDAAIESAPRAQTAVLAQLGDALHHDGLDSITPSSGHVLDADTRFQRLVRIAVRVLRQCIRRMLAKHEHVHVIMAEGNHDMASSVWLREIFSALYEDEPRVTVDTSPDPYYCYEHGSTSLFFHHSHKAKMDQVSRVFAGKFREVFGRTKYSYGHTGHLHHVASKEDCLMVVEQHPTLCPTDAYASRSGYLSQSGARVITYHKEHGEVGRTTIRPEMVQAA